MNHTKIKVRHLTQVYSSGKGIFNISFDINAGEVFGYLGPNGAGKTTTIRNLMGFTNADMGVAQIEGMDCRKDAHTLQQNIGYIPGEITFFDNMHAYEFISYMADLRRMDDDRLTTALIDMFDLDISPKIKKMSKGMKQKVAIITAFMHDPDIYILDEPTSGLDPLMQSVFLDLIHEEKRRGKTILMSSHSFDEVEKCCDRAGIIKEGRIVSIKDIKSLREMTHNSYIFTVDKENDVQRIIDSKLDAIKIDSHRVRVDVGHDLSEMFQILSAFSVNGMQAKPLSLERVFMEYYKKDGELDE
jgi:ABC-2 type transport system ATP-binding protein